MAVRDRNKLQIECPECKEKGILHISEDDHPYMKSFNRAVDIVEGKFTADMKGEHDIKITCLACGHEFIE